MSQSDTHREPQDRRDWTAWSVETLDLLVSLGERALWVRGAAGPHWALLGGGVELRRTELDLDAAAARVAADSAYENVRAWVDEYIVNNASDLEALAAFTPRTRVG